MVATATQTPTQTPSTTKTTPTTKLWRIEEGELRVGLHEGQYRAMQSQKRFIFMLAGTQGGKTSFEPWWLAREIDLMGAGDYLAVTASFDLFKLKFLPTMREVFEHVLRIGRYWSGDRVIELVDPRTGKFTAQRSDDPMWARIILRSAEAGGGLESSTGKAALLDEAGMDAYQIDTWEAVLRRLSLYRGRVLAGTTLYNMGWVKTEIYDPWQQARKEGREHPEIDVIQFDSTLNPAFPVEEYERARATMPLWKFNMFYRGQYERPAGLIYDSFDEQQCVIRPFAIPEDWPRYLGLDFGGVNTAGIFFAQEPLTRTLYAYREYKAGGRTARGHAEALLEGEAEGGMPYTVGGSHSEDQWRDEFAAGGLSVQEPDIKDVEVGIQRVYGAHKLNRIRVFNTLTGYLGQKRAYSRKVDDRGEPTEDIADKKSFHFMDAERYIIGKIFAPYDEYEAGAEDERPVAEYAGSY